MNDATKIGYVAASAVTLVAAYAAYDSFSVASFILYKNQFIIPAATTLVIALISFGGVFAYPYLQKPAGRLVDRIRNDFEEQDGIDSILDES